jgi:glutamate-1-semialdehyde 2,1-aminomutase
LRRLCSQHGSVLIFDEVMTGFRVARGGAAEAFSVQPDLWTFGKIVGGGLPAAAYGGRKDVMEHVAPLGRAYQAGTLSGNPLAMAAGLATLQEMESQKLSAAIQAGKLSYVRKSSFFCFFFGNGKAPRNFAEVSACNMNQFNKVYHAWLNAGIYMGPSGYEVGFLSTEHSQQDLERLVSVVGENI